jgi:hypothetical protein
MSPRTFFLSFMAACALGAQVAGAQDAAPPEQAQVASEAPPEPEAAAQSEPTPPAESVPSAAAPLVSEQPPELSKESEPRLGARIELSLLSAPLGASAGLFVCVALECDDPRAIAGSALGGAAAGVLLSALTTRYAPIPFATAQAIEGGAVWGSFSTLYLWLLAAQRHDERVLFASLAAGEVLGAGVGGLLERSLRPSSGAVALANSGALWSSAITTLLVFSSDLFLDGEASVRGLGAGLFAAQAIGLGVGGALGQRFGATRTQVWLSDVGAGLIGGTLPLLTWLIGGRYADDRAMMGSTAAGIALGFVGAYVLTEFLPRRKRAAVERAARQLERVQLALMPLRQGGGLSITTRLH